MPDRRQFLATTACLGGSAMLAASQSTLAQSPVPTSPPKRNHAGQSNRLFSGRAYPSEDRHAALRESNRTLRLRDKRPNVLILLTDQQAATALSGTGNPWVNTPHLDALATRGLSFRRACCTSPICGPSRGSLMTGLLPHQSGVQFNGQPLREGVSTMGQYFQSGGYETTYLGKWHLPESYVKTPDGLPGFVNLPMPEIVEGGLGDQSDFLFATQASYYLRWHAALSPLPWLCVVSLHNPHDICKYCTQPDLPASNLDRYPPLPANFEPDPLEPEFLEWRRAEKRYGPELRHTADWPESRWRAYLQTYYHMTQSVDRACGVVLSALADGGWLDQTLVIFASDHGEGLAAHRWVTKNSFYEESVAVPFLISWPGRLPAGQVDATHNVSLLDVLPTVADYAGLPTDQRWHGRSLRPLLESPDPQTPWDPHLLIHLSIDPQRPERQGRMLRTDRFKYCAFSEGARPEQLFDLDNDPGETRNLAFDPLHTDTRHTLRARLRSRLEETNDPFRPASGW